MAMREPSIAVDPDSAKTLVESYGGFDDCFVERVTQDFKDGWAEISIDNIMRGIDVATDVSGVLLFRSIDYMLCRIPFVGGRVRIESCDVGAHRGKIELKFGFSTTEWLDVPEFSAMEFAVVCGSIEIRLVDVPGAVLDPT